MIDVRILNDHPVPGIDRARHWGSLGGMATRTITRWGIAVLGGSALLAGCTSSPPPIPRELVYWADEDRWELVTEPVGEGEPEYPESFPVTTRRGSESLSGFLVTGPQEFRWILVPWAVDIDDRRRWAIEYISAGFYLEMRSPSEHSLPLGATVRIPHKPEWGTPPRYIIGFEHQGLPR